MVIISFIQINPGVETLFLTSKKEQEREWHRKELSVMDNGGRFAKGGILVPGFHEKRFYQDVEAKVKKRVNQGALGRGLMDPNPSQAP